VEAGLPATLLLRKYALLLVIDDSAVDLSVLRSTLEPSGYDVVTATTMAEGLEALRHTPPDLILCDVTMPGGSGYDFLDAVRADARFDRIPVILITTMAVSEKNRLHWLARGAARYIVRPVEPELLLREIATCLPPPS
jgi:two-component system cell cycle response regulator